MPTKLSQVLNISRKQLYDIGMHDSWIDHDNLMFIDVALFKLWPGPFYSYSATDWQKVLIVKQHLTARFNVARCLASMVPKGDNDIWIGAVKTLIGGKHLTCSLGYQKAGIARSLISPKTAGDIFDFLLEFKEEAFPANIVDLLSLLGQRIGWELFNDLIVSILAHEFAEYTEAIKEHLKVDVPLDVHGQPVVFVPEALLRNVPISEQLENGP